MASYDTFHDRVIGFTRKTAEKNGLTLAELRKPSKEIREARDRALAEARRLFPYLTYREFGSIVNISEKQVIQASRNY